MKHLKNPGLGLMLALVALGLSEQTMADSLQSNQVVATYTYMGGQVSAPASDASLHPLTFANISPGASQTAPVLLTCVSCSVGTTVQVNGSPAWLHVTTGTDSGSTFLPNVLVQSTGATTLSVKVNSSSLKSGSTYNGSVTITGPSGTTPVTVYVSATVNQPSVLSANPSSLSFTAPQGSSTGNPSSSVVQIIGNGATLNYVSNPFTANGNGWLVLQNPNGTTGGTGITVSVNPTALAPGIYNGIVNVQSYTTSDSVSIPVSLTVPGAATLSVTPTLLAPFLFQIGQSAPASQQLMVVSSAGSVNFSVTMSPAVPWLITGSNLNTASTTGTPVAVSVNPSGLSAGNYFTTLFVATSGGTQVAAIPVSLIVSTNPLLTLPSTPLTYTAQFSGVAPADQQVPLSTIGGSGTVGFIAASDSPWLTVSPATGAATSSPTMLTIHVNPQSLQIGNYTGVITVLPTNGDQYSETIPVSLAVSAASQLVAGPPGLLFSYEQGLAAPPAQSIQITGLGQPASFTLTSTTSNCGTGWLSVTPSSFTTPATLTVSVLTSGMTAGTCSGNAVITYNNGAGNTTLPIPITVNVSNNGTPLLNVAFPQTVNGFGLEVVQQNSTISRGISLTTTDPAMPVSFAVSTVSSSTPWLFAATSTTSTPQTITVTIVPAGLAPGTYNGTLQIASTGLPSGTLTIPMTLIVTPNVTVSVAP